MNKIYKEIKFNITAKIIYIFIAMIFVFYFTFLNCNNANADLADGVAGWAWSENIGWISFNSINCDVDGDGTYEGGAEGGGATPAPAGCPIVGAVIPYGVDVDLNPASPTFEHLSGYAWSENIGWITFDKAVAGNPPRTPYDGAEIYMAKLDTGTNNLYGWARALNHGGGWDGWIKLRKDPADIGPAYGTFLNTSDFEGWAWGDVVVGWVSFNSKNCDVDDDGFSDGLGGCPPVGCPPVGPMGSYKVYLTNDAPTVTTNSIVDTNYCIFHLPGGITLSWAFLDTEDGAVQTAYEVEIIRSDAAPPCLTGKQITTDEFIIGTDINSLCPGFIDYGGFTYTWKVKVYDSNNINSGFVDGEDFPNPDLASIPEPTPIHHYPTVDFSFSTVDGPPILQLQDITFDPLTAPNDSICYDNLNNSTPCPSFEWDFEDDGIVDEITLPASPNAIHFYSEESALGFNVVLKVTDTNGYNCSTSQLLTTGRNVPDWNETIP